MIDRTRSTGCRESGVSAIEVVVGLMILSTVLLGIAATSTTAARSLSSGRLSMENAAAIQYQTETLMSLHFDSLTSGTSKVDGVRCTWAVSGSEVKRVVLEARFKNGYGDIVKDTTVLLRTDPDP